MHPEDIIRVMIGDWQAIEDDVFWFYKSFLPSPIDASAGILLHCALPCLDVSEILLGTAGL